jgi:RNAse (barnase) inhibitor barstar
MDVNALFRTTLPYLHRWSASLAEAYEFAWSIQQSPGRQAIVRVIRGAKSRSCDDLFNECGAALQFPNYFGENWDALFECLTDLEWLPGDAYTLVVTDSHVLLDRAPKAELGRLLDVLAFAAHEWTRLRDSQNPPRPFHVVFQCDPEHATGLEARLRETDRPLEEL